VVGATMLPEKELLVGITPGKGAGSDYDLVIVGYDGKVIDRHKNAELISGGSRCRGNPIHAG